MQLTGLSPTEHTAYSSLLWIIGIMRRSRARARDRGCVAALCRVCRHVMDVIDVPRSTPRRNWIYDFFLFSRCRWMRARPKRREGTAGIDDRVCCCCWTRTYGITSFICLNNKRLFIIYSLKTLYRRFVPLLCGVRLTFFFSWFVIFKFQSFFLLVYVQRKWKWDCCGIK